MNDSNASAQEGHPVVSGIALWARKSRMDLPFLRFTLGIMGAFGASEHGSRMLSFMRLTHCHPSSITNPVTPGD